MLAIAGALLIPACGGGGGGGGAAGGNSPYYVSTQQFEAGTGFYISGNGSLIIMPEGKKEGLPPTKGDMNTWTNPKEWSDDEGEDVDLEDSSCVYNGTDGTTTSILSGTISFDGSQSLRVNDMIYEVSGDGRVGHVRITFSDMTQDVDTAFAEFMGLMPIQDLDRVTGNVGNDFLYMNQDVSRVLVTSMKGSTLHVWINLHTGDTIMQLYTVVSHQVGEKWTEPAQGVYMRGVAAKAVRYNG